MGFIVFGSEAWVPVTSLGACDQSVCLEEYQLPVELDTKDLPQFSLAPPRFSTGRVLGCLG